MRDEDDIILDADDIVVEELPEDQGTEWFKPNVIPGEIIDAEVIDDGTTEESKLKSGRALPLERAAKSGVPGIDEWMHFFGKILIRSVTNWYITWAFRDIDEDLLSDREIERIRLSDDARERMARPFAEFASKNKFTRKHGRSIIAMGDSADALLEMGLWFSRVARIASKYRRMQTSPAQQENSPGPLHPFVPNPDMNGVSDERTGPRPPQASNGYRPPNVPDGARIINPSA